MPAAAFMGKLALGIGLVFLRSLAAHFDDRADDRVPLQPVWRHAQHIHRHAQHVHQHVAQRIRIDRELDLAFGLESDMLNARLAHTRNFRASA